MVNVELEQVACPSDDNVILKCPNTRAFVGQHEVGTGRGGDLFVASDCVSWIDETGNGFALVYQTITLHGTCRDLTAFPHPCIYLMIDGKLPNIQPSANEDGADDDEDEDSEADFTIMRFVPVADEGPSPITPNRFKQLTYSAFKCTCASGMAEQDISKTSSTSLENFVASQNLDGTWKLSLALAKYCERGINTVGDLRQRCLEAFGKMKPPATFKLTDKFVATALAVAILRQKFESRRPELELVEQKATNYLFSIQTNSSSSNPPKENGVDSFSPLQLNQFIAAAVESFLH